MLRQDEALSIRIAFIRYRSNLKDIKINLSVFVSRLNGQRKQAARVKRRYPVLIEITLCFGKPEEPRSCTSMFVGPYHAN